MDKHLEEEKGRTFFFTSNIVSRWHNCAIMNGKQADEASSLSCDVMRPWAPSKAPLHLKSEWKTYRASFIPENTINFAAWLAALEYASC